MKRLIELMLFAPAAAIAVPVLVDSSMKGALLLTAALLTALALRNACAALRHQLLVTAMFALLALPLLSWALPAWRILPGWAQLPKGTPPPAGLGVAMSDSAIARPAAAAATPIPEASSGFDSATPNHTDWRPMAAWVWGIGGGVVALWLTLGQLALLRLGRRATPAPRSLVEPLETCKAQLGVERDVLLLLHPLRPVPMTWGIFKSRVLLPAESEAWAAERLRAVLLHELAHIKRNDCMTQLLVRITCAVHWFNPLAWYAAHKIATERERACDDLVLGSGVRASDYAGHVLEIATCCQAARSTGSLAMAKPSRLEGRLSTILSRDTDRRGLTRRAAITLGVALSFGALPIAMMQAVAEEEPKATRALQPHGSPEDAGAHAERLFADPPQVAARADFSKIIVGKVISSLPDHGVFVIDAGKGDGLRIGQTVYVLRDGRTIASGVVVDLRDSLSGCSIQSGPGEPVEIKAGDRVYRKRADGEDGSFLAGVREAGGLYLDLRYPEFQDEFDTELRLPEDAKAPDGQQTPNLDESEITLYQARSGDGDRPDSGFGSISLIPAEGTRESLRLTDPWGDSFEVVISPVEPETAPPDEFDAMRRMMMLPPPSPPSTADRARSLIARYPANTEIRAAGEQIAALEAERQKLLRTYVAKSPRVIAVEERIENVEKKIVALGEKAGREPLPEPPLVGVGAVLHKTAGGAVVVQAVIEGGQADLTNSLRAGDQVVAVDVEGRFVETESLELGEVVELIRGEAGTTVRLKLEIDAPDRRRQVIVEIERAPIDLEAMRPPMTLRSYALKFTDASAAAESIRQFVGQKATVEPDARTNSIIVHGDDAAHDLVERMIEFYDVE